MLLPQHQVVQQTGHSVVASARALQMVPETLSDARGCAATQVATACRLAVSLVPGEWTAEERCVVFGRPRAAANGDQAFSSADW